jgi:hypothetical protein
MKVVFGMFLGVLLTIAVVFTYDTVGGHAVSDAGGSVRNAADGRRPVVNWDVVSEDWHQFMLTLGTLGEDMRRGWRRLVG